MRHLLANAGRSFVRAFGAQFLVSVFGILAAPDVSTAIALSLAALVACLAAGLRALQEFVPMLTTGSLIHNPLYAALVDSFLRASLSSLVVFVTGWLLAPNLDFSKGVIIGIVTGALAAGFRALESALTHGDQPAPNAGF
jgi:hypothetical protein